MKQLMFSVIIPTYHRNDFLAKCLDCLAPGVQTLPSEKYEVVVTDDGSKTTAEEMIQAHYPWARWVAGPRKGPAANRNNGARYAKGEWLAFTDDDCLPSLTWLSAFSLVLGSNVYVYEGKTTCKAGVSSPLEHSPVNLTGGYLWSCNMLIQAGVFQELGGFDEAFPYPYMEDTDFRERLKSSGYTIFFAENATIDHPPTRLSWGDRSGATQESLVYYWRCKEHRKNFKVKLLKSILHSRLKEILAYPVSRDSFEAAFSLVMEVIYIISRLEEWDKKYSILNSQE